MTPLRSLFLLLPAAPIGLVAAHAGRSPAPLVSPAPTLGTILFQLSSAQDGAVVLPGQEIAWELTLESNGATHFGLAGFAVDLRQDEKNPSFFDLPPGQRSGTTMLGFDRPLGFSNPGPAPKSSGFGGVPTGEPGARNLEQIGGLQNSFGSAPDCLGPQGDICSGQRVQVELGVAQAPGGEQVASGSFLAPRTPGLYTFTLANPQANVLAEVQSPPTPTRVEPATCTLASPFFQVRVQ
ncbi:MAG: hypothetical protein AAF368_08930 [Planctomycetota bacterium]